MTKRDIEPDCDYSMFDMLPRDVFPCIFNSLLATDAHQESKRVRIFLAFKGHRSIPTSTRIKELMTCNFDDARGRQKIEEWTLSLWEKHLFNVADYNFQGRIVCRCSICIDYLQIVQSHDSNIYYLSLVNKEFQQMITDHLEKRKDEGFGTHAEKTYPFLGRENMLRRFPEFYVCLELHMGVNTDGTPNRFRNIMCLRENGKCYAEPDTNEIGGYRLVPVQIPFIDVFTLGPFDKEDMRAVKLIEGFTFNNCLDELLNFGFLTKEQLDSYNELFFILYRQLFACLYSPTKEKIANVEWDDKYNFANGSVIRDMAFNIKKSSFEKEDWKDYSLGVSRCITNVLSDGQLPLPLPIVKATEQHFQ